MSRLTKLSGVLLAVLAACGGDSSGPQSSAVLTTLTVSPTSGTIPNTPPANSLAISVTAKDQNGNTMVNAGTRSFTSSNPSVATVDANGIVTSVAVGTATITASLTIGSVTRTATTTVTVEVPAMQASVTAPALLYLPSEVHVRAGGTVTWTMASIPHTVTFTAVGSPNSIPELREAAEARTFTEPGTFPYQCNLHTNMRGNVYVH